MSAVCDAQHQLAVAPTLATPSNYPTFPQAQTMAEFPSACHDMLHWDELLTDKEKETKYKVRKFMVRFSAALLLLSVICCCNLTYCTKAHRTLSYVCARIKHHARLFAVNISNACLTFGSVHSIGNRISLHTLSYLFVKQQVFPNTGHC